MLNTSDQQRIWAMIVAKAWADEAYKARLLADPADVLRAEGLEVPAGVEVKIVEATRKQTWLVLPAQLEETVTTGEERLAAASYT